MEQSSHYEFFLPDMNVTNVMSTSKSNHAKRRHAQHTKWSVDVLPQLIRPFLRNRHCYFRGSAPDQSAVSGLSEPLQQSNHCPCVPPPKRLSVLAVYLDRTETLVLQVCACRAAPIQLIERGLFPCAPVLPTLAVCLNMLEFVSELFVNLAPNERAWVATLEAYLRARGFLFKTEVHSHHLPESSISNQLN